MSSKTSYAVRETIVHWLQVQENFLLITGAAAFNSAVVSGKKLKKKDAYEKLAKHVNEKHQSSFTPTEIKYKYDWLLNKFKAAKEISKTEDNIDKLQEIAPFYKELDKLFGNRQNINPFSIFEPIENPELSQPVNHQDILNLFLCP